MPSTCCGQVVKHLAPNRGRSHRLALTAVASLCYTLHRALGTELPSFCFANALSHPRATLAQQLEAPSMMPESEGALIQKRAYVGTLAPMLGGAATRSGSENEEKSQVGWHRRSAGADRSLCHRDGGSRDL